MERGILVNTDNFVVYAGSKKMSTPPGLSWHKVDLTEIGDSSLRENGHYLFIFDGSVISKNQVAIDHNNQEIARKQRIDEEQESSGLKKVTIEQAHDKIDQIFSDTTTVPQLRNACMQAFKIVVSFILR